MTRLLEQAVARVKALSDSEQDAIAQLVMEEIESERKWDELFERNPEKLGQIADRAWSEHEAGKSDVLDPDTL